ncbi:MAG: hypothetical protein Q7T50_05095 [Candidatus Magasanikbacteria bacterium]|nr:hypothetical protein [Candidatus Magasanikbacteria bacterium]
MTFNQKQNFAQAKKGKEYENGKTKKSINFRLLNKFLMFFIIIAGVYYVVGVNDLAIKGFVLRDLKIQAEDLIEENNQTELAIMKFESYENIEKRAKEMNMVKVSKIEYITVSEKTVARK